MWAHAPHSQGNREVNEFDPKTVSYIPSCKTNVKATTTKWKKNRMPSKYCILLGKNSTETTSTKPTSATNLQNCVQRNNFNTYITVWLQEYFHTVFKRDSAANLATFTIVKVCWVQACYCLFSPTQLWLSVSKRQAQIHHPWGRGAQQTGLEGHICVFNIKFAGTGISAAKTGKDAARTGKDAAQKTSFCIFLRKKMKHVNG